MESGIGSLGTYLCGLPEENQKAVFVDDMELALSIGLVEGRLNSSVPKEIQARFKLCIEIFDVLDADVTRLPTSAGIIMGCNQPNRDAFTNYICVSLHARPDTETEDAHVEIDRTIQVTDINDGRNCGALSLLHFFVLTSEACREIQERQSQTESGVGSNRDFRTPAEPFHKNA